MGEGGKWSHWVDTEVTSLQHGARSAAGTVRPAALSTVPRGDCGGIPGHSLFSGEETSLGAHRAPPRCHVKHISPAGLQLAGQGLADPAPCRTGGRAEDTTLRFRAICCPRNIPLATWLWVGPAVSIPPGGTQGVARAKPWASGHPGPGWWPTSATCLCPPSPGSEGTGCSERPLWATTALLPLPGLY